MLHDLTVRVAEALAGAADGSDVGQHIGRELIRHSMTDPRMLTASLNILRSRLLRDLRIDGPGPVSVLATILENMVVGFVGALTDHVRDAAEANARDERAAWREYQQLAQDRARHDLHHDPTTGLPNRALLQSYLDTVLAAKPTSRIAVCRIVLDRPGVGAHMPAISDHDLRIAATRLRAIATEHDYFVAHLGDEQFVLVNENTAGPDDGIKAAEIALRTLAQPPAEHRWPQYRVCIGIAEQAINAATAASLLRAARTAAHWARTDRDDSCWALFDASRFDRLAHRQHLVDKLRATATDCIDVLYEPILRVHDSAIVGTSASPVWHHPDGTTIAGHTILSLADEAGIRPAIDMMVLRMAYTQAARWYDTGALRFVTVDLSSAQMRNPGLVPSVAALLDTPGLPPAAVHLTIDDEALRAPDDGCSTTLEQLHRLGVVLAANIVGTGHATLTDTPVQTVNLDPTLIRCLTQDAGHYRSATTRTAWLIDMLHDLDFTITAPGVTTLAQYETLHDLGCDQARGSYLARPVPATGIDRLLHR
ncbi:EAL domain-containing protein [Dactylosporangium sp. CA-052675]|uniref:EAL domain-containing protein n=1 Tax=Dactylosporangium sp. CA-052675 TaxID=3239927 RepID=UPI003D8CCBD6